MSSPPDRPNILFVFTDQQRFDWGGTNADVPVRTPNLDRLADRGVEFTNAVCPSPLCGPSRSCLASGMEYDRCGMLDHTETFPLGTTTYYGRLRDEAGYHVMGCGKFDLTKPDYSQPDPGFDWGVDGQHRVEEWGFSDAVDSAGKWDAIESCTEGDPYDPTFTEPADPYMAYLADRGFAETHVKDFGRRKKGVYTVTDPTPLPEHTYADNWVATTGLELLSRAPTDQPWHLVVNFSGPHAPMDVTEEMYAWYRDPDVDFPAPVDGDGEVDPATHQAIRRNYAAMVENIDRWLGRYVDKLRGRGDLEETLVVFASDHGEMLGDYGRWKKGVPHQPSVGVPMTVAGPGVESLRVDTPATVLDLHATFCDYAGLDPGDVDSRSLRPVLGGQRSPADHRDAVYSGYGAWRLAFDGRHKLVTGYDPDPDAEDGMAEHDPGADPLLFDLTGDAPERHSAADDRPDVVADLRETIEARRNPDAVARYG
jgi:choline-sulfatase